MKKNFLSLCYRNRLLLYVLLLCICDYCETSLQLEPLQVLPPQAAESDV